jgi:hypothetical protein
VRGKSEGDRQTEREERREKERMTHGDKYSYFRRQGVRKTERGRKWLNDREGIKTEGNINI